MCIRFRCLTTSFTVFALIPPTSSHVGLLSPLANTNLTLVMAVGPCCCVCVVWALAQVVTICGIFVYFRQGRPLADPNKHTCHPVCFFLSLLLLPCADKKKKKKRKGSSIMSGLKVFEANDVKVYNLTAGREIPAWLSERKRRQLLKKDPELKVCACRVLYAVCCVLCAVCVCRVPCAVCRVHFLGRTCAPGAALSHVSPFIGCHLSNTMQRRVQLIQDFEFPTACTTLNISPNQEYVLACGSCTTHCLPPYSAQAKSRNGIFPRFHFVPLALPFSHPAP